MQQRSIDDARQPLAEALCALEAVKSLIDGLSEPINGDEENAQIGLAALEVCRTARTQTTEVIETLMAALTSAGLRWGALGFSSGDDSER